MGKNGGINKKYKVDGFRVKSDGTIDVHFSFHDSVIINDTIKKLSGKKLELQLDAENSFSPFHTIIFNDYIVKQNAEIKDAWIMDAYFSILDNGRYVTSVNIEYFVDNKCIEDKLIINSSSIEFLRCEGNGVIFPTQY